MATVLASYKQHNNPGESAYRKIGATTYRGAALPFSHSLGGTYRVTSIMFELKKTGSPTEPVLFSIYTYNGGTPVGTLIGQGSLAAASIGSSYAEYTVSSFSGNIDLVSGTSYWVRFHTANDGTDDVNYFQIGMANISIPYSSHYYEIHTGFVIETGWNFYFEIQGNPVASGSTPTPNLLTLGVG